MKLRTEQYLNTLIITENFYRIQGWRLLSYLN